MPRSQVRMMVDLDGVADPVEAVCDQRDYAALEVTDFQATEFTRARYMAWNALRRSGQYKGDWKRFNTVDCIEVYDRDVAEALEDVIRGDGLDPGRPVVPAAG